MSFKLTVDEEPRMFSVNIGYCKVGTIKSHKYDTKEDEGEDLYYAKRIDEASENGSVALGWYKTMEDAVGAIVEYSYGESKIAKMTERPV
jgi:hypothetical protein